MIRKDKVAVISNTVDDTLRGKTSVFDIHVFGTFVEFQRRIDTHPLDLITLVITSDELPFTNTGIIAVKTMLDSPFLNVSENVLYLISEDVDKSEVLDVLKREGLNNWQVYQGTLDSQFVTDLSLGLTRSDKEQQKVLVTYRVRASEYVKSQASSTYTNTDKQYLPDDAVLYDEEVDEKLPIPPVKTRNNKIDRVEIVGKNSIERTLLAFLVAQYCSTKGKTLIVERDVDYHRLSDLVLKAEISMTIVDISDIFRDISATLDVIKTSSNNLIVVVARRRMSYEYNFLLDVLINNLRDSLHYVVVETLTTETHKNSKYLIATQNTVPEITSHIQALKYSVDFKRCIFVGVETVHLGNSSVNTKEMEWVIEALTGSSESAATVFKLGNSVELGKGGTAYDILSLLTAKSSR